MAGLPARSDYANSDGNNSVSYIEVINNGVIVIDYKDATMGGFAGKVHLTPSDAGGGINWACSAQGDFQTNTKLLPSTCR